MDFIPQETYDKIKTIMPICCIDFFIVRGNKVLLGKRVRNPYKWERFVPWWRILHEETQQEVIRRKLKEETDISLDDVIAIDLLGVFDTIFPLEWQEGTGHTINCTYIIKLDEGEELPAYKLDQDHTDAQWFTISPSTELNEYINGLISSYLARK